MKKNKIYLSVIILALIVGFISGCETTPTESCEQDEICSGKTVTACCTETSCYYEYNGVQYGDDAESLARLAAALGCASAMNYNEGIDNLILRLEAIGEIARNQSISNLK